MRGGVRRPPLEPRGAGARAPHVGDEVGQQHPGGARRAVGVLRPHVVAGALLPHDLAQRAWVERALIA